MISLTRDNVKEFMTKSLDGRFLYFTKGFSDWIKSYDIVFSVRIKINEKYTQASSEDLITGLDINTFPISGIDFIFSSDEDEIIFKLTY